MYKNPKEKLDWRSMQEEFLGKQGLDRRSPTPVVTHRLDYQVALEEASKRMIRFRKPEHLIKMIVRLIDQEVGVVHTAVLLYKKAKNSYVLIDSKGQAGKKIPVGYIRLSASSPIISVFADRTLFPILDENGALVYNVVNGKLNDKKFLSENPNLHEKLKTVKGQLDLLQADICVPSFFKKNLLGVLILGNKLSGEQFRREEIGFFLTLANNTAMIISNAQLIETLQEKVREIEMLYEKSHRLFIHTSIALATAIDARDQYTHGHTERVTSYCLSIAEELTDHPEVKAYENFRESLHIAALLHDIGKIGIPDNILNKKEQLTDEEFTKIREHPLIGATILYPIRELGNIISGVRSHQERFDGTGYPDRLKGKNIPLLARIIAVADTFDAMTTNRPYRDKKSIEDSVEEIKKCSGTQFDPDIVQAFLRAHDKKRIF